jgi:hypothetical protein
MLRCWDNGLRHSRLRRNGLYIDLNANFARPQSHLLGAGQTQAFDAGGAAERSIGAAEIPEVIRPIVFQDDLGMLARDVKIAVDVELHIVSRTTSQRNASRRIECELLSCSAT